MTRLLLRPLLLVNGVMGVLGWLASVAGAQAPSNPDWEVYLNTIQCSTARSGWLAVAQDPPGYGWTPAPGSRSTSFVGAIADMDVMRMGPRFQDHCCRFEVWQNTTTRGMSIVAAGNVPGPGFIPVQTNMCCEDAAPVAGFDPFGCTALPLGSVPGAVVIRTPGGFVSPTGPVTIPAASPVVVPATAGMVPPPGGQFPPPGGQNVFANPTIGGSGVDICLNWGTNCGKPAADAFCQRQGFAESVAHTVEEDAPPTLVIGDNAVCGEAFCDRFGSITCTPGPGRIAGPSVCEWVNDGECDEPGIGTGACAPGTDAADCAGVPGGQQQAGDLCEWANDGECDEPGIGTGYCPAGTDASDCRQVAGLPPPIGDDSCQYANDGECDEPGIGTGYCLPGTDTVDCRGGPGPGGDQEAAVCPTVDNGTCDEPGIGTGTCPAATDTNDCLDERVTQQGGQIGEVTVTLAWNSDADLDLRVVCPSGETVYYSSPSACGGELDVDMNASQPYSTAPVENIRWLAGSVPAGHFVVQVDNYSAHSDAGRATPFTVRVLHGGQQQVFQNTIREEDPYLNVYEFDVR